MIASIPFHKRRARRRVAAVAAVLSGGLVLLSAAVRPGDDPTADLDGTRAMLERWVETRRLISQERRDWALGKEMLEGRIEVVQAEIDALRGKTGDTRTTIDETEAKRSDLAQQKERLEQASSSLVPTVIALEDRTRQLLRRLPEWVQDHVKLLSQRLPEDPHTEKLSLSERFANVVGILNEIDRFNREVLVTSEVRTLPDGTTAEVATLYIGVAMAYYVSADRTAAGVGTAGETGWTWKPANAAAEAIATAIAIAQDDREAAFVCLPVEIQ